MFPPVEAIAKTYIDQDTHFSSSGKFPILRRYLKPSHWIMIGMGLAGEGLCMLPFQQVSINRSAPSFDVVETWPVSAISCIADPQRSLNDGAPDLVYLEVKASIPRSRPWQVNRRWVVHTGLRQCYDLMHATKLVKKERAGKSQNGRTRCNTHCPIFSTPLQCNSGGWGVSPLVVPRRAWA